jgi:ribosomal protein L37AE/L43A
MRFNERRGQRGVWECRKCTHVITADEHDEMVRWAERGQL